MTSSRHAPRYRIRIRFAPSSGRNPGQAHWDAARRVLRYLKGTKHCRLVLGATVGQIFW